MNLLTYTQNFANSLKTGQIYQVPLNPQEAVMHRSIGFLLDKAINSIAGMEMASDMLVELLGTRQEIAMLVKVIDDLKTPPNVPAAAQAEEQSKEQIEAPRNLEETNETPAEEATA